MDDVQHLQHMVRFHAHDDYPDPAIIWCKDELGEDNFRKTWFARDAQPIHTSDIDFFFLDESDFVIFCLKFGHRKSNYKTVHWKRMV